MGAAAYETNSIVGTLPDRVDLARHSQCFWTSDQRNDAKCFSARRNDPQRASGQANCEHVNCAARCSQANKLRPADNQLTCTLHSRAARNESAAELFAGR